MSGILAAMWKGARPWLRPAPLAALAIAVLALLPALLLPGLVATRAGGDSPFLLERVHQMVAALSSGHLPPRWMPDGAFGLGYPFWSFYAPLVYGFAGLVALAGGGIVGGIKVAALACFLLAAAGMYRLGERTWGGEGAGLVASAAYTLAPYHLVDVYVRGDALAELAAYAVFPWLLLAVDHARRRHSAGAVAALALATGALVVAHNISALMFLPVLALYIVWPRDRAGGEGPPAPSSGVAPASSPPAPLPDAPAPPPGGLGRRPAAWTLAALDHAEWRLWPRWRRLRGRGLLAVAAGLGLGLALAAWFWVPALAERDTVQLTENTSGYFHYDGHFRGRDAVDPGPLFDYRADAKHSPWRVGLVQLVLALVGTALAWRLPGRRRMLALWLVVALAATWMITPLSGPLWARVPLLPFVQFPWRWLAVLAFALALLTAPVGLGRWWRSALAVVLLAVSGLAGLAVPTLAVRGASAADIQAFEVFSNNPGTTVRGEYLPTAVAPRPSSSVDVVAGRPGGARAVSGLASATLLREEAAYQDWQVEVPGPQPATLAFPTLWFPGWTATLTREPRPAPNLGVGPSGEAIPTATPDPGEGRRVETRATGVQPGSGWMTLEVPPGRYLVRLALAESDPRALAESVSFAAGLLWLALLLVNRRRRWRVGFAWLALGALAAVLLARALPVGADRGPVTLDRLQSAWPHANPSGLRFDEAHLAEARLSTAEVRAGQDLGVDFDWTAAPDGYNVTLDLVSPAEPVFDVPDLRATVRGPVVEGEDRLTLTVPADTPDGLYFLRLGVTEHGRPVDAESLDGFDLGAMLRREPPRFELGQVYLGPVRVRSVDQDTPSASGALTQMGDVTLARASTEQEGRRLRVDLTWQADKPLATEYKTSVRLLGPDGKKVVEDDKLPLYGYFPSTAWPVGLPWVDHRWLDLPPDVTPGNGYTVQVVLYTEAPPEELGSVRVPGVSIVSPTVRPTEVPHVPGTD